jgi:hypothetical protein
MQISIKRAKNCKYTGHLTNFRLICLNLHQFTRWGFPDAGTSHAQSLQQDSDLDFPTVSPPIVAQPDLCFPVKFWRLRTSRTSLSGRVRVPLTSGASVPLFSYRVRSVAPPKYPRKWTAWMPHTVR